MISGLPVELHDGSVGKVTARIPWPNPLTSTVGLSLESLHLTFHLLPPTVASPKVHVVNLADSVMSAAETFINEELAPDEEASFRTSYQPEMAESLTEQPPGGLDPFLRDEESHEDGEPQGVSLFATLIENLLARFEFDATDTKITLVDPLHASFSIALSNISYRSQGVQPTTTAESANDPATSSSTHAPQASQETRTVTLTGFTITTRCLKPLQRQSSLPPQSLSIPISLSPEDRSPPSPYSDSSDMDEEAQMLMSQSIAVFPHPAMSMSSSVGDSIYHSTMSTAMNTISEEPSPLQVPASPENVLPGVIETSTKTVLSEPRQDSTSRTIPVDVMDDIEDETVLSISTEPIVVSLTTPPLLRKLRNIASGASSSNSPVPEAGQSERRAREDKVSLNVSVGVVACALRARHIQSLLRISRIWGSGRPVERPKTTSATSSPNAVASIYDVFTSSLRVRGAVLLLLPSTTTRASPSDDALTKFFHHPLAPPHLPYGYVRLHLDSLDGSLNMEPLPGSDPVHKRRGSPGIRSRSFDVTGTLKLADVSAFAFLLCPKSQGPNDLTDLPDFRATPLLITDPHLPRQYRMPYDSFKSSVTDARKYLLPEFDIIDWTDPKQYTASARPSLWRTKIPRSHSSRSPQHHASESTSSVPTVHGSPRKRPNDLATPVSSPSHKNNLGLPASPGPPNAEAISTSPSQHSGVSSQNLDTPALSVKLHTVFSPQSRSSRAPEPDPGRIDVNIAPLHCFVDFGLVLGRHGDSEALKFLQEITAEDGELEMAPEAKGEAENNSFGQSSRYEDDIASVSQRVHASDVLDPTEMERDRRRLEKLLLEDLDLQLEYREGDQEEKGPVPARTKHKVSLTTLNM